MSNTAIKESTVKRVISKREYKGERRTSWYFTVEMENGDKGEICRDTETGVTEGMAYKYTVETNARGYVTLKEVRPPRSRQGYGSPATSPAAVALTAATNVAAANIRASGKPLEMSEDLAKKITGMADTLHAWLTEKEK